MEKLALERENLYLKKEENENISKINTCNGNRLIQNTKSDDIFTFLSEFQDLKWALMIDMEHNLTNISLNMSL